MPHWQWRWHAEIEKFPSAVMATRHPKSINLGDVTAHDFTDKARSIAIPDVLIFGSPCQDFSIAGRRAGMDGKRGNLSMVALDILGRLRPRWFVFENVPGLLSIDKGRGFQWFLRRVDELGYFGAWASLDAQYFGVAQRRKRVFFVGHIGDWRGPAAVLLEPQSLCGNYPPRREAGQGIANTVRASASPNGHGHSDGLRGDGSDNLIIHTLNAKGGAGRSDFESETLIPTRHGGSFDVAHSLRADGFDASEDGTGRGTPLVPVAFDTTQITSKANRCQPRAGDPCHPLAAGAHPPAVAFDCKAGGNTNFAVGDVAGALRGEGFGGGHAAVAFDLRGRESGSQFEGPHNTANIRAASGGSSRSYVVSSAVRRLTPRECERLQGFPEAGGYTAITYRNKPAADGPRYKALGNSMAVPVVRWILSRIEYLEAHVIPDDYDPQKDLTGSIKEGFAAICQRIQQGGEGWQRKT